ncbi:hypothetical protein [Allostreptomyces psammosilenae]|uniref:Uncharacterized protein n=1 Tax=Allostreptomyces psammosilenae TaxID=1892865 RepID=A0A852ZYE4_9ACTN|nr:hypothetical protein [Allostreptomyces psammosilenae]NYI07085.1 hypothetical protein [Allostreptomyces psammosilenae]
MDESENATAAEAPYCAPATPTTRPGPRDAVGAEAGDEQGPRADCVLCGKPTEFPASVPGMPLCPVCEWQESQRAQCSG